ncbi:hypothetical protein ACFQZS_05000 [Mucilaginibacter calamicampi]|uniref:Uncharacterized protein n=1 Tax=Mucilaginibacter calamicampi TaxID=1302352 RepID=A0ABW2YST7_9SPHI
MTNPLITKKQINLGVKVCDCFFSCAGLLLMLYFLNGSIPPNAALVLGIIVIAAAIILLIAWNYHADNEDFPYAVLHAWLVGVIRYSVAYTVATYGFAKILKTQFAVMYSRNDTPVGSLSGFELTWNYFGYSYKLAIILAVLQIGGAILLLFRRTTLLGLFVLMPVMLNIVLINAFYSIAVGAFLVSVILTAALTYLLVLNREPIIRLFFNTANNLPALQFSFFKWVIRVVVIALSFFTIYRYIMYEKPIDFVGKWKVEKLERNGQFVNENAWVTDSTAWKCIYIEEHGGIALSPNPYVFEPARAQRAMYKYDEKAHKLNLTIFGKSKAVDSMAVMIIKKDKQHMQWVGTKGNNQFKMYLVKTPASTH